MSNTINISVCGAHMSGLPLNHQLIELGASFVKATRTQKGYRLYNVPEKLPPRPGMVRDEQSDISLEMEVWSMPIENFGAFMIQIASPLCIGTVFLEDGSPTNGFLCESDALKKAEEISSYGGWRGYLKAISY